MEDTTAVTSGDPGITRQSSTKVFLYVALGIFLFIAILAGLYLTQRTQNVSKQAQETNSCQGEDKIIADQCPEGYTPIGTIDSQQAEGGTQSDSGVQTPGKTQLCCQRQSIPPTNPPPPTDPTPTPVTDEPTPTPATQQPTPTSSGPTVSPTPETPPLCGDKLVELELGFECIKDCQSSGGGQTQQ